VQGNSNRHTMNPIRNAPSGEVTLESIFLSVGLHERGTSITNPPPPYQK